MEGAAEELRALARRIVDAALALGPLRGALLAGSAGRGDADEWSDVDLLLYVDELPPEETLEAIRVAVGGADPYERASRTEHAAGLDFFVGPVLCELVCIRAERVEWRLNQLLVDLEGLETPSHKAVLGIIEGLVLEDDGVIERWRARLRAFPEPLRRALIELHWRDLVPLWYWSDGLEARDAELFRLELVVDGALRLLGVLAALNRVYYSRFQLKRVGNLVAQLPLAPPDLAARLEALPRLPPREAADELGRLAEETRALVRAELPELELPFRFPPGTRQQPLGNADG